MELGCITRWPPQSAPVRSRAGSYVRGGFERRRLATSCSASPFSSKRSAIWSSEIPQPNVAKRRELLVIQTHRHCLGEAAVGVVIFEGPEKRAAQSLAMVGLADRAHHFPSQMSGGQQQRVAIARALVNRPAILLADEPTGNLDSRTSVEIMEILQNLNDQGLTIVLVTHEHDIAEFAKRVLVFRDGRIRKDDPVLNRPKAADVLKTLPTLED